MQEFYKMHLTMDFKYPMVNFISWMLVMQIHHNFLHHTLVLDTTYKNRGELVKGHEITRNYSTFTMHNLEIILRELLVF
jgi:hypothetical protein